MLLYALCEQQLRKLSTTTAAAAATMAIKPRIAAKSMVSGTIADEYNNHGDHTRDGTIKTTIYWEFGHGSSQSFGRQMRAHTHTNTQWYTSLNKQSKCFFIDRRFDAAFVTLYFLEKRVWVEHLSFHDISIDINQTIYRYIESERPT